MKKYIILIVGLLICTAAYAANLLDQTEDTAPTADDMMYCVNDPAGTAADRKCTVANVAKGMTSTNLIDTADILYETELDTEAELETQLTDASNVIVSTEIDTFAELDALVADESLVTEDDTETLTNKTIDADNNTVSNIDTGEIKAATLVIESEGIASNDNDTTIPTSAAVKDYADSNDADTQLTEEQVEDFVGGMLGGTETLITVTYQDVTNDIDFVVDNDLANYSNATSAFLQNVSEDSTPSLGGDLDGDGNDIDDSGVLFQREQADADVDVAGQGQWWVNTATPNEPYFTGDTGNDWALVGTDETQTLTNKTIDGDNNTIQDLDYDDIKSADRTGSDVKIVTGTAGGAGNCAEWNADGDLVEAASAAACGSGGSGDNVSVNSTGADTTANFLDNIYMDFDLTDGGAGGPDDITSKFEYAQTLAGNPALLVDECTFFADTSGGGFICEGSTADTSEQVYRFPDNNGSDTDQDIVLDDETQTLTNKTLTAAANVIEADTGDSATSFFSAGTIEHERGGLEADVSAYSGLTGINSGSTTEVDTEAELETHLGGADVVFVSTDDISSANLITLVSDESGSGVLTMGTSATHTTPLISGKIDADAGAVNDDDCTGEQGLFWYDDTDSAFEFCNANSGTPTELGGGGSTNWDAIGDPSGDGTVAFAGTQQLLTSTLDDATAGTETALTIENTDTLLSNDAVILDLMHSDDDDANQIYLRALDNDTETVVQIGPNHDGATGIVTVTNDDTVVSSDTVSYLAEFTDDGDLNQIAYKYTDNSAADTMFQVYGEGILFIQDRVQAVSTTDASATCLSVDSDRFFGDTDCDETKDGGEEYIDQAGSGSPGGANEQIQYNNSSSFGGIATFVYDGTNIGIGTHDPSEELHIEAITYGNKTQASDNDFTWGSNNDVNLFNVDASADAVGIGTHLPEAYFSVGETSQFQIDGSGNVVVESTLDAGGATSLEIPNSATPTVNAAGEIAVDTTVTSYDGLIKYYDGTTEMTVVAMPTADLTTTDNHVVAYASGKSGFNMEAQAGGGGGGDSITVNSTTVDTTGNLLDNIYMDFDVADGGAGGPDDITSKFEYAQTLAGNPALLVDECTFVADTSGGGFICEGSTADTAEQMYRFPDVNGSDTTSFMIMDDQSIQSIDDISLEVNVTELRRAALTGDVTASAGSNTTAIGAGVIVEDDLTASFVFDDGDLFDFGSNVTSATEGIMLPAHATDCSTATAEGQVCWEEDAQVLYVGNGSAAVAVGSGTSECVIFERGVQAGKMVGADITAPAAVEAAFRPWYQLFDDSTDEQSVYQFIAPDCYDGSSTIDVTYVFSMADAQTGDKDVEMEGQFMCTTPSADSQDFNSDGFSSAITCDHDLATNQTGGYPRTCTASFTNAQADGMADGDACRFLFYRDAAAANDATGDVEIIGIRAEVQ